MKNKKELLNRREILDSFNESVENFEDSIELSETLLSLSKDASGHLRYYLVECSHHIEFMWKAYSEAVSFMNQVIDEQEVWRNK